MTTSGDVRQASLSAQELLPGILDLERLEVDLFRGRSPREDLQRVFGGQVAGQAMVAAGGRRHAAREGDLHALGVLPRRGGRRRAPVHNARGVPAPAEVRLWQDRLREFGDRVPARWLRPRPVEVRYIGDPPWLVRDPAAAGDARTMVWMRAVGSLPDDPLLRVCAAAYASDTRVPHRLRPGQTGLPLRRAGRPDVEYRWSGDEPIRLPFPTPDGCPGSSM